MSTNTCSWTRSMQRIREAMTVAIAIRRGVPSPPKRLQRAVPLILTLLLLISVAAVAGSRTVFAVPAVTTVTVCDTATVSAAIAGGGDIVLDCGAGNHTVVL